jgi:GNAT superfamily N-acetyltransferase
VGKEQDQPEYRIEPLGSTHNRAAFSCGVEALDNYFRRQVSQDVELRTAVAFVLTPDSTAVAGFYTLSSLAIRGAELPEKLGKKLPSIRPIGVTLLGRMAVSAELKGKGLGEFLLMHALEAAWLASQQVASWAVVVDPKEDARGFYLKYGFIALPSQPNRLFLPMKTIEQMFVEEQAAIASRRTMPDLP